MIWLWIGTLIASLGLFLAARNSWREAMERERDGT